MKRCLAVLLCLLFCLSAGCSTQSAPAKPDGEENKIELTAQTVAAAVAESQSGADELAELSGDVLTGYLNSLGLTGWEDAAVRTGQGMDGREITVVRMADKSGAETAAQCLEEHRQARVRDFFGYAPDQADLLENAQVLTQENFAAFLACTDGAAAKTAFAACFDGSAVTVHTTPSPAATPEPKPEGTPEPALSPEPDVTPGPTPTPTPEATPEPTPEPSVLNPDLDISGFPVYRQPGDVDMTLYDNSNLVAAWGSGDDSGLSDKDRAILEVCRTAFDAVIREGMTDVEKELALHDWLMAHGKYDDLSRDNVAHIGRPNNTDPYGMLVNGYGICLGFATTFQLLMDLAEVECITVVGAAYRSTADHAWNMVKLDGEWYCVDVTWNNSYEDVGGTARTNHKYFNVTSAMLREHDHQWDYRNTPEATATRYYWNGTGRLPD